ncbi:phytoene dehydrogenase-like protein [Nocardioides luteus]|uniref:Amine oxidase domain-containing protein n=1 Tax=Nocardioides luteus TaxID=1844 RepID=A0ABQ5T3J7_9ACTN|nr:phytoene dehydrogenase-like protein [Nocardioides luteus]GGR73200.1 hypothetical protein GCM10010197_45610 [Nocardioides luteus]GLJ70034.1 hypothetical protein GCM10017579_40700 [Nocardioides luteus]
MSSSPDHQPRRIAVVGSGIAGLTAAYVASRHSEVTLFEGDDRLGGLAGTPHLATAVDTGFVHDRRTHPMLQRLLDELGVQPQTAGTSMSVRSEKDAEYAAVRGIHGLLPDRRAARRAHLRMLAEVVRFQRLARALIIAAEPDHRTLDSFLDEHGFTPHFRDHYLAPLVAAVWSCDLAMALDLPVRHLFEFFDHLGVLDAVGSPRWRTVSGGSVTYVDRVAATIRERGGRVRTSTRVVDIVETAAGTEITDGSGHVELFDAVVLATHPAQSLAMLGDSDATQWQILGTDAGLPPADEADSASAQPLGPPSTPPAESEEAPVTGVYRTTIGHARRAHLPVSRFTHPAHWQVVDLGRLPDHGLLGRFEARDRLGDPRRAIRENLDAFLAPATESLSATPAYCWRPSLVRSASASARSASTGAPRGRGSRWPPSSRCSTPTAPDAPTSSAPAISMCRRPTVGSR